MFKFLRYCYLFCHPFPCSFHITKYYHILNHHSLFISYATKILIILLCLIIQYFIFLIQYSLIFICLITIPFIYRTLLYLLTIFLNLFRYPFVHLFLTRILSNNLIIFLSHYHFFVSKNFILSSFYQYQFLHPYIAQPIFYYLL